MKKKIIAFIALMIGISLIIIPIIIINNKSTDNKKNLTSSLFNNALDIETTHEDKNIKINDFIETNEFYAFNFTNNSNKTIDFELLTIEFLDKDKKLITIEEFTVIVEKGDIKTFKIRKDDNIKDKVKYIKFINSKNNVDTNEK